MRIGLIAMSGVRACDQELLRLGLTLPGFVERSKVIASLPSLGLLTLAALTPAGHELTYLEVADLAAAENLPDFDLVAVSTYTAQAADAYTLADRYRQRGARVVIGGLHATALPHEAAAHCDAVVAGSGEPAWPRLVADADAGRLEPLYDTRHATYDLSAAPMPAFELLDISRYNRLTVQTSRGCPWRCEFCASSLLLSGRYQQKPAEKVLAEIDRICALWPRPFIELADDNTFVNRAYWRTLLPRLAQRRLRWFTETDISVGEDDQLLELMRDSGCAEVLIGLESPSPQGLAGLELHGDFKRKRLADHARLIRNIQSHGIRVNGCFILGLDGQGPDIFDQVFEAVERLELFDVQITLQTAFPGTPLYDRLLRENRLLRPTAWETCTLFDVNFQPAAMTAQQLAEGFRALAVRLYSEQATHARRQRFNDRYLRPSRPQKEILR